MAETRRHAMVRPLRHGADIVVMVHPDYQYSPRLVAAMASMIASGHYDVVLGSRDPRRHCSERRHAAVHSTSRTGFLPWLKIWPLASSSRNIIQASGAFTPRGAGDIASGGEL